MIVRAQRAADVMVKKRTVKAPNTHNTYEGFLVPSIVSR